MANYKVIFRPANKEIETDGTKTILELARSLDLEIKSLCGGMGQCRQCKVNIEGMGEVLACQTRPDKDLKVNISVQEKQSAGKFASFNYLQKISQIVPFTYKIYLELNPPSLDDNQDDLSRLKKHLLQKNIDVHILLKVLRKLSDVLRKSDWKATVTVATGRRDEIIEIEPGKIESNFGLAIDVGTTTVAVALINLLSAEVIDVENGYNKQVSFGEDVLSRIAYAQNGGLHELNSKIIETLNELIKKLLARNNINIKELTSAVVSGNTVMLHLLLQVNPSYIRVEPYIPTANHFPALQASELGLAMDEYAKIYCVPGVSSYVGGDVVSDIIASDMHKKENLCLLIDLGTNGEIVLGNKDWMLSCSCSAGPAFEGVGIEKGMVAADGAIESVNIESQNLNFKTIGNGAPKGICGSGMIDLLAVLFRERIIDRAGELNPQESRVTAEAGEKKFFITDQIWIKENEIRNLIRSKAAVFSGCKTLLDSVEKNFSDVGEILVAGGLGNYLNIENAVAIGMLPDIDRSKFKFIGNSSLSGAHSILLSKEKRDESISVGKKVSYLELSANSKFMDEFTSALFIPHTNLDLFPSLKK
jgi:uncharacterized 2Fe-2S/4Fe-4S cluster protein (DUF4445 family)